MTGTSLQKRINFSEMFNVDEVGLIQVIDDENDECADMLSLPKANKSTGLGYY